MRFSAVCALAFTAIIAPSIRAADVTPPTVELRIRSVNQLLPSFEYVAGILNQAEAGKQGVEFLKTLTDEKTGIDGIDPTRPFGLSATLTKDVVDSPVIVMLPLADEAAFLGLLRDKLNLDPKKTKGVYEVEVPNVPTPIFFRFTQGYVVATAMNAKNIDDGKFTVLKDFFATAPEGIADLKIHLDRVPADVTKVVLAQLELKLQDELAKKVEGESAGLKLLKAWLGERLTEVVPMLLKQGKLVHLTLNADAKSDAVTTALRMTAKDGTPLAAILAGLEGRSGQPLSFGPYERPVVAFHAKMALPSQARESFEPVLEALLKDFVDSAKESDRGFLVVALDAIKPTLSAAELDIASAYLDDVGGKTSTLAVSMKLVKGTDIEKLLKLFGPFVPAKDAKVTLAAETFEGVPIHKIELTNEKTDVGRKTIWVVIRDDRLVFTVEAEPKRLKALLAAKPNTDAAAMDFRAVAGRLPKILYPTTDPKLLDAVNAETFGEGVKAKDDDVRFTLVGGKELRLTITARGKAIKFVSVYGTESKK